MLVDVRPMRDQGRRLPWSEIDHGKVYRGHLRTVSPVGSHHISAAQLLGLDGTAQHLLPDLYEPEFAGVGDTVFHLRGVERLQLGTGVHAVVQEWRCTPVVS
jgi:hypothetical protein